MKNCQIPEESNVLATETTITEIIYVSLVEA